MSQPVCIVWFRQDLRVIDNPALLAAVETTNRSRHLSPLCRVFCILKPYTVKPGNMMAKTWIMDRTRRLVRSRQRRSVQGTTILRALAANETAMRAKRQALAATWTRLLWRQSLVPEVAHTLRGAPDAFDSLMQTFWLRLQAGKLTGPLRVDRARRALAV